MADHATKHTREENHVGLGANIMLCRFLAETHEVAAQGRLATDGQAPGLRGKGEEIKAIIAAVEVALSTGHSSEVVAGKQETGSLAAGSPPSDATFGEETVDVNGRK